MVRTDDDGSDGERGRPAAMQRVLLTLLIVSLHVLGEE